MNKNPRNLAAAAFALTALMTAVVAPHAAETSIATTPLAQSSTVLAKPNIMFILDASGSMASSYMPDDANAKATEAYAYKASQCNGLAYDPTYDYTTNRPLQSDGATQYPNASTSATPIDGFNTSGNPETGSSSTSVTIGTGVKTIYLDGDIAGMEPGMPVRIASASDSSTWMQGIVNYWNSGGNPRRQLVVDVASTSGSGTVGSWTVTLLRTADLSQQYYYTYSGGAPRMGWTYTTSGAVTSTDFYKQCASDVGDTPGRNVFTKVQVSSLSSTQRQNYANWYAYFRTRILLMRTAAGRAFAALNNNYRVGLTTIDSTGVANDANFQQIGDFDSTQRSAFLSKLYARGPTNMTPLRASLAKVGRYYANKISGQVDPVQYSCQRNYAILSTDGYWNTGLERDGYEPFKLDGSTYVGQQDGGATRPQFDGAVSSSTVTKTWERYQWVVNKDKGTNGCGSSTYSTVVTLQTRTEEVVTVSGAVSSDTYTSWSSANTSSRLCLTTEQLSSWGLSKNNTYYSSDDDIYVATTSNGTVTASSSPVVSTSGGSSDSLADVAQYYYTTDLRDSALNNCSGAAVSGTQNDACRNNVPSSDRDTATWQHMTTSTIGLGVSGTLAYDANYLTQSTGDYVGLTQGTKNWPVPGDGKEAVNIDDLWHAAVNGRGRYFSALNATSLVDAIATSLTTATATPGAASAAATNSLKPVDGENNQVFVATYTTVDWTGDLTAYPVDAATAAVDKTRPAWSAQTKLDALAPSSRAIYYRRPGTGALRSFSYSNLNNDGYGAYFTNFCTQTSVPSQCSSLGATQLTAANTGDNLVNFLRGDKSFEAGTNTSNPLYRTRAHTLGDIVNGAPVYVGAPPQSYADSGYNTFKSNNASRKKMIYAAANDGMLHAFSAESSDGGTELWAYVPTLMLPKLYRLADTAYAGKHQPYVDAAPVVGDVKIGSSWKTILVGGMGAGGKGYYALDVTDPANPSALWEFTDANLGLSFGNPIITKHKNTDGSYSWVVVVSSGYNNTSGDGRGHLFMLDAATGAVVLDLSTSAGTSATPSGLAKINAWVDDPTDNTALRFYGGDMLGNLWRFDTEDLIGNPGREATLLAQFMAGTNTPQPITTAPQPVSFKSGGTTYAAVIVGTGSYLGSDDPGSTTQQSIYTIKDSLTSAGWGDVRQDATLVSRSLTIDSTTNTGSIPPATLDWATKIGWKLDLPESGERIVTDMLVQYNTLAAASAIPGSSVCTPSGGGSWLYLLDVSTGTASSSNGPASSYLGGFLAVGLTWIQTTNGSTKLEIVGSDQSITTKDVTQGAPASSTTRRTSWRELID